MITKVFLLNRVLRCPTLLFTFILAVNASAGPLSKKEEKELDLLLQEKTALAESNRQPQGIQLRQELVNPNHAIFYAPRADHPYSLQMVHRASTPFKRGPRRVERIEVELPWGLAKFEVDRVLAGVNLNPHYQWIASLSEIFYLLQRHPYLNDTEEFLNQAANFLAEVRALPEKAKQDPQLRQFLWNVNKAAEWARQQGPRGTAIAAVMTANANEDSALQVLNKPTLPDVFNDGFFSLVLGRRLLLQENFRERHLLPTTRHFGLANGGDEDFDEDDKDDNRGALSKAVSVLRRQLDLALMQGLDRTEVREETLQQVLDRLAKLMKEFRNQHPYGARYYQLPPEIRRFLGTSMALETFQARAFVNQYILASLTYAEDAGTYFFTSMRPPLNEDELMAHHPKISPNENRLRISPHSSEVRLSIHGLHSDNDFLSDTESTHRRALFELMDRTQVIWDLVRSRVVSHRDMGFEMGMLQPFTEFDDGRVAVADIIAKIYAGIPANTVLRSLFGFDPFLNVPLTVEAWSTIRRQEDSAAWVRAQRAKAGMAPDSPFDFSKVPKQQRPPVTTPPLAPWQDYPRPFDEMVETLERTSAGLNRTQLELVWARWVFQLEQDQTLTPQVVSHKFRELLWRFHPDLSRTSSKTAQPPCDEFLERDTTAMRAINTARHILLPPKD